MTSNQKQVTANMMLIKRKNHRIAENWNNHHCISAIQIRNIWNYLQYRYEIYEIFHHRSQVCKVFVSIIFIEILLVSCRNAFHFMLLTLIWFRIWFFYSFTCCIKFGVRQRICIDSDFLVIRKKHFLCFRIVCATIVISNRYADPSAIVEYSDEGL